MSKNLSEVRECDQATCESCPRENHFMMGHGQAFTLVPFKTVHLHADGRSNSAKARREISESMTFDVIHFIQLYSILLLSSF